MTTQKEITKDIMQYAILEANGRDAFASLCNEHSEKGWEPCYPLNVIVKQEAPTTTMLQTKNRMPMVKITFMYIQQWRIPKKNL